MPYLFYYDDFMIFKICVIVAKNSATDFFRPLAILERNKILVDD